MLGVQLCAFILGAFGAFACIAGEGIEEYENFYNEIHTDDEQAEAKTRNALKSPLQRWPGNSLSYRISSDYTAEEADNVRKALDVFNQRTCLSFEEIKPGSSGSGKRYIYYKKAENVCGTRVGYNPIMPFGSHDVQLNSRCLSMIGVIQHETLHVLGLFHEQSRPDRDDYVQIDFDNIPRKFWSQFIAQTETTTTTYDVPYDYQSVMHYSQFAFAKDPSKPSIRALINGELVERTLGQVVGPSEGDLTKVRRMYKCDDL